MDGHEVISAAAQNACFCASVAKATPKEGALRAPIPARGSALARSADIEDMTDRIKGILSPVLTPFKSGYVPDVERFVSHCRWLLANGVSLAVFGTNSEANSLSENERVDLLERLV